MIKTFLRYSSFNAVRVSKFGGPEVMEIEKVKEPSLQKDQVLIDIKAAGINPVDTYIRSGIHKFKPKLPYTPGFDGAGIIEKVFNEKSKWKVGDRVYLSSSITGTYSEKAICLESQIHNLPTNISFEQGAGIYIPYGTAYNSLFQLAKIKKHENILIHGASGAVGIASIQFAKQYQCNIIGTASSKEGLELIEQLGAKAFNHKEEGYEDKILEYTNNKGVNVILEMLSNVNLDKDINQLIGQNGRIIVIGCRGSTEISPRNMMSKNVSVIGMTLMNASDIQFKEIFENINQGLKNNSISPIISNYSFDFNSVIESHKHIIERPSGTLGKVILYPKY